ncbi:MAG TPA: hypothetical protein DIT48_08980 [Actinobacteria bacterium]|nr:hypothetical protein [Actinomycetota bacterium]
MPFRLVRFPAVLVAVFGASIILAVATASGPLFLSSAGTAAVQQSIASAPAVPALSISDYSDVEPDLMAYRERILLTNVRHPSLRPPVETILDGQIEVGPLGSREGEPVVPTARTDFLRHIRVVSRAAGGGDGVWLVDALADSKGIHAGDTVSIRSGNIASTVRVAGIYRDLMSLPRAAYWAPLGPAVYGPAETPPPTLLLMDTQLLVRVSHDLGSEGQFRWEFSLASGRPTLPGIEALQSHLQTVGGLMSDPTAQLGAAFAGSAFQTPVPQWVDEATSTVTGITGSVDTLSLAGRLVALLVVAAVGLYGVQRRRVEFDLLQVRGVSPVRLGVRATVEAVLPAAIGAVGGFVAGVALVRWLGPSNQITSESVRSAARAAVLTAAVSVVLVGITAAVTARARREARGQRVKEVASKLPWELVVLTLAAASFYEIHARGAETIRTASGAPTVDRLLLLFPVLFVAGAAGLVVRWLRRLLPRLRSASGRASPALYLALRRLAGSSRMAAWLVTASALAVGMLAYAGVLSTSIRATANEKASLSVGADVAVTIDGPSPNISTIPLPVTIVNSLGGQSVNPGPQPAEIEAVDPATFPRAAFWDSNFASSSLPELLRPLAAQSGDRLPVLVVGGHLPAHATVSLFGTTLPVTTVGAATAFPGMRPHTMLLVVDRTSVERLTHSPRLVGGTVLWAKGSPSSVIPILRAHGIPTDLVFTAIDAGSNPTFLALSWTFQFLQALGVLTGLVVLVGLLLYLQARQRAREVAYALSKRMGLTPGAHRASVMAELAGMLLTALVLGVVLAVVASFLIYARLDPLPNLPPTPLLRMPFVLFGATLLALAAVALIAASWVQRRADRVNVAEVMRLAG